MKTETQCRDLQPGELVQDGDELQLSSGHCWTVLKGGPALNTEQRPGSRYRRPVAPAVHNPDGLTPEQVGVSEARPPWMADILNADFLAVAHDCETHQTLACKGHEITATWKALMFCPPEAAPQEEVQWFIEFLCDRDNWNDDDGRPSLLVYPAGSESGGDIRFILRTDKPTGEKALASALAEIERLTAENAKLREACNSVLTLLGYAGGRYSSIEVRDKVRAALSEGDAK